MNTDKVTRLEIIDHRPCGECEGTGWVAVPREDKNNEPKQQQCVGCGGLGVSGRTVMVRDKGVKVYVQLQDRDRTLKIFIDERNEDATM